MNNLLILTSPDKAQRIEFLLNGNLVEVTELELDDEQGAHLAGAGDIRPDEAESQIAEYLKLGWEIHTPMSFVALTDDQLDEMLIASCLPARESYPCITACLDHLVYHLFVEALVMSDGYRFDLGADREESMVNAVDQLYHAEQS